MKLKSNAHVQGQPVTMDGAAGCRVRWLIGADDAAPNFAMRQFEVEPGGYTPRHHHPYEHEVFVLSGRGVAVSGDQEHEIGPGSAILVEPDEVHQFRNTGGEPLNFLCLVPNVASTAPVHLAPECGQEPRDGE